MNSISQNKVGTAKTPRQLVLVADDDTSVRQLLELTLRSGGYEVISAANGHELVQLAQQRLPNLILADVMMPQMDGYEAIRQMRNDTRTAHIPMLILTAHAQVENVITGFETGADDYIAKPFDVPELLARVKGHLRRASQRPMHNPLSGLPGGLLLVEELRHRLECQMPLALLYTDLDHFKTFNDTYGFTSGDKVILLVASIMQEVLAAHGNPGDFIGHIGGDDFAVLTTPDCVEAICNAAILAFDKQIRHFYKPDDWQRGYLSGVDRYGILRRFDLLTISIGVVTTKQRTFKNEEELARTAAEMKHFAKAMEGSSFAIDQRVNDAAVEVERRVPRNRTVVVASTDASLRTVLRTALQENRFSVVEVDTVERLAKTLDEPELPTTILADAQLGDSLRAFCSDRAGLSAPPIVLLSYGNDHDSWGQLVTAQLHLPLPLSDVLALIDRLTTAVVIGSDEVLRSFST
ncbi:MAG TPA: response regulator [Roseiflexaceae bacterium]|nr:response regulator [Roseiflexaceae bacterium]